MTPAQAVTIHASAVAIAGRCVLLRGASGSGKSATCLDLLAAGGILVSDDRTMLRACDGVLDASAPETIDGLIEARGVGLLRVARGGPAPVTLIVDLDRAETDRLPPDRHDTILGISLPTIHGANVPNIASVIALVLRGARLERP